MKLIFKLWGFHPDWLRDKYSRTPWVKKRIGAEETNVNNYCISFLRRKVNQNKWEPIWTNYELKKL